MIADEIVNKPVVDINCPKCKKGILWRTDLSRLEEGLGHEGFTCEKCKHSIKYVPKAVRPETVR